MGKHPNATALASDSAFGLVGGTMNCAFLVESRTMWLIRTILATTLLATGAKAQDLTMLEHRFGLPVFQTGPNDKALWWTWRILTKHKQIGEAIFARPEECEKYNHLARNPETIHIWCAANVPPYCEELSKEIDGIDEITSAEAKRIGRSIVTKMSPPKGFECLGIPTAYHGVWCAIGDIPTNKYRRCRQLRGEQDLEIRARSIFNGEVDCKPLAVKPKGNSHLVQSHCIFDVGERSSRQDLGPTKWERWRLTDGGRRLEVNETSNKGE
jgi:hypothetical protein